MILIYLHPVKILKQKTLVIHNLNLNIEACFKYSSEHFYFRMLYILLSRRNTPLLYPF